MTDIVSKLVCEAQNEHMIDQHYLPTGELMMDASVEIEQLRERETYLEMIIEAFLIQYGKDGVADWAVAKARAARAEWEANDG